MEAILAAAAVVAVTAIFAYGRAARPETLVARGAHSA
jgi:hypothetical protein